MMGASSSTATNETLESSENLVEFCLRGLGEIQLINRAGWSNMAKIEEDAKLYDLNFDEGRLSYEMNNTPIPGQPGMFYIRPPPDTVPAIVGTLKCSEISTVVYVNITLEPNQLPKKLWTFIPLNQFIEEFPRKNKKNKAKYMKLTIHQREELFWINHIRRRAVNVVPGIQRAIVELGKKGVEYWKLPDGTQVSLDKIRIKTLEVVPKFHSLVKRKTFGNPMGTWIEMQGEQIGQVYARRLDPELGIVSTHYVLEVNNDSDDAFIIDPTGIQFGLKGPKSTVIWYGTWKNYVKEFPGKVLGEITQARTPTYPTLESETFFLGEGPMKYITRLKSALVKRFGKKICARCGLRPGPKLLYKHNIGIDSPFEEAWEEILERNILTCPSCSDVSYCNKICMKLDAENHVCA